MDQKGNAREPVNWHSQCINLDWFNSLGGKLVKSLRVWMQYRPTSDSRPECLGIRNLHEMLCIPQKYMIYVSLCSDALQLSLVSGTREFSGYNKNESLFLMLQRDKHFITNSKHLCHKCQASWRHTHGFGVEKLDIIHYLIMFLISECVSKYKWIQLGHQQKSEIKEKTHHQRWLLCYFSTPNPFVWLQDFLFR